MTVHGLYLNRALRIRAGNSMAILGYRHNDIDRFEFAILIFFTRSMQRKEQDHAFPDY